MSVIGQAYQKWQQTRFPLPSEETVSSLESRIGVTFPEDYRRFLLEYNGGFFTEPQIVPPPGDDCPIDRLTYLCGIGASHRSAELATPSWLSLFDDNDPPQVIPIGYTIMGNCLLLVTHPEGRGNIVLSRASLERSNFLANGIEEFFTLLREPQED